MHDYVIIVRTKQFIYIAAVYIEEKNDKNNGVHGGREGFCARVAMEVVS